LDIAHNQPQDISIAIFNPRLRFIICQYIFLCARFLFGA
jgi:hypothetical protein